MKKVRLLWICPECKKEHKSDASWEDVIAGSAYTECPHCGESGGMYQDELLPRVVGVVRENVTQSSKSQVWLTPRSVWEPAQRLMGGTIDLDPCAEGEPWNVPATVHWTKSDDALSQASWEVGGEPSKVFMNAPYDRSRIQERFVKKLLEEVSRGHVSQAVVLMASRTDTVWYDWLEPYPRCKVKGRLRFLKPGPNGPVERGPATFPSVIFGIGIDVRWLRDAYRHLGGIYVPYRRGRETSNSLAQIST